MKRPLTADELAQLRELAGELQHPGREGRDQSIGVVLTELLDEVDRLKEVFVPRPRSEPWVIRGDIPDGPSPRMVAGAVLGEHLAAMNRGRAAVGMPALGEVPLGEDDAVAVADSVDAVSTLMDNVKSPAEQVALDALHRWLHSPTGDCELIEAACEFHEEREHDDPRVCVQLEAEEREAFRELQQELGIDPEQGASQAIPELEIGVPPSTLQRLRKVVELRTHGNSLGDVLTSMLTLGLEQVAPRQLCMNVLHLANEKPLACTRPAGHEGNHADGDGASWIRMQGYPHGSDSGLEVDGG